MSEFPGLLQGFFAHLVDQRDASRHTIAAYRDTFRLFLAYASDQIGKAPSDLGLPDLDADQVTGFLSWLETDRHNSVRTRNTRLAGLRSFYHYASYRAVEHADSCVPDSGVTRFVQSSPGMSWGRERGHRVILRVNLSQHSRKEPSR